MSIPFFCYTRSEFQSCGIPLSPPRVNERIADSDVCTLEAEKHAVGVPLLTDTLIFSGREDAAALSACKRQTASYVHSR